MIELVFVIVVLGILAVAIPKLTVTRDDAMIVKGKSHLGPCLCLVIFREKEGLKYFCFDFGVN